jgi:hypothetical protein
VDAIHPCWLKNHSCLSQQLLLLMRLRLGLRGVHQRISAPFHQWCQFTVLEMLLDSGVSTHTIQWITLRGTPPRWWSSVRRCFDPECVPHSSSQWINKNLMFLLVTSSYTFVCPSVVCNPYPHTFGRCLHMFFHFFIGFIILIFTIFYVFDIRLMCTYATAHIPFFPCQLVFIREFWCRKPMCCITVLAATRPLLGSWGENNEVDTCGARYLFSQRKRLWL